MPQSLTSVLIHLVFGTKNREPFLTPAVEGELHPYMATIFRDPAATTERVSEFGSELGAVATGSRVTVWECPL